MIDRERYILNLFDSPFPDTAERNERASRQNVIRDLESELALEVALRAIR